MDWTCSKRGSGRTVKKIFDSKLEGSRRKGRPRVRWLEGVQKDLEEMKVRRWLQKTVGKNGRP